MVGGVAHAVTRRWLLGAASAVVAAAAVLYGGWLSLAETVPWDRVTQTDAQTIQVHYTGGDCQAHATADVREESDGVRVRVRTWQLARGCSDVGVPRSVTARVDSPLDGRSVVPW